MALPSDFSSQRTTKSEPTSSDEWAGVGVEGAAAVREGTWQFFAATQQLVRSNELKALLEWPEGREWDFAAAFAQSERSKVRLLIYAASESIGSYCGEYETSPGTVVQVTCQSFEDPHGIRIEGTCRVIRTQSQLEEVPPVQEVGSVSTEEFIAPTIDLNTLEELERWRHAVAGSNLGVWDWDLKTNALFLSGYLPAMLGYEPNHAPAVYDLWTEHLHPSDRRPTMLAVRQHLAGLTKHYRMEHRLRHRDGTYRWALARGAAVRDALGVPVRFVGVCTDITRRVETRIALEASEARLRAVFDGSFDGILLMEAVRDQVGKIIDFVFSTANAQAHEIVGCSPGTLIGKRLTSVFEGPEWEGQLDRFIRVFLTQNRDLCELRQPTLGQPTLDGPWRILRQQVVPVESGVAVAISDITENRANEDALRASEKLVSEIAEAVPEFLYVYDFDTGWVSYRNRSLRAALGYTDRTALDYPDPVIAEIVHPDDQEMYRSFRPLKSMSPTEVEVRVRRADGEFEWIAVRESVFSWNEANEPAQAIGSVSIITEKKRAEERMREHVLELHRTRAKLKARQSELETHNDHLSNLARKDGLTDVYNHRAFQERLAEEVARCQRSGASLSLMIADIDDFKAYNDRYGHLAGDERLRRFSAILQSSTRPCDFVARYGGEEFAIILPDANAPHAEVVGNRILRLMAEEPEAFKISASFGVSELGSATPSPLSLIAAADAALYEAKHQGKGRVSIAPLGAIAR